MKKLIYSPFFQTGITKALLSLLILANGILWGQGLPSAPKQKIETAIKNWNEIYGANTRATGWKYEGVIKTEQQRTAVIAEITNPEKAWLPQVNINNPSGASADKVSSFPSIPKEDLMKWKDSTKKRIQTGQHKVRINWKKGSTVFTTLCITDDKTIVYDNMFSNTAMQKHHSRCYDSHLCWIWQSTYEDCDRGAIWADLFVKCDDDGTPHCTNNCGGWMSGGSADCKCVVTIVGNCCHMEYTWAFACGFKKVKFKLDAKGVKFEAEIEGYLGSEGSGNGSCEECCPKKTAKTSQPSKPVQTPGGSVGTSGQQRLATVSVKTIQGEVVDVKVPNNVRPGDAITASVVTSSQSATLQGAVIDVQGNQTNIADKLFKITIPAGVATVAYIIKDKNGSALATGEIPVNHPAIPIPADNISLPPDQLSIAPAHAPGNFAPINYCQPGQPLTINGFFDGEATNTKCSLGGRPVEIIAESPRVCFVQVPDDMPGGRHTLTINEQGVSESVSLQVVTTNLTSNKKVVQKNTRVKVNLSVNNLENVDLKNSNFKVELTNGSPETIQFRNTGSNSLSWDLTTENVRNGTFSATVDVVGIAVGNYTISANLTSSTCTDCWKQYEACIARVEAEEKKCYEACDKSKAGTGCYLACSTAARAMEIECFAEYLGCMRKKLGY